MSKIKYIIEKHKQLGEYILWKEIASEKGYGTKRIFKGTKKECENKLKEIRGENK